MPAITAIRNGVPIGFDPDTGKWFAEVDGKRTSSQQFETLFARLDSVQKKAIQVHQEIFEVTTLALGTDKINVPTPVKLQLAWDAAKGAPVIKKYRMLTEGQGWRDSERNKLLVANPFSLPAALKASMVERLFNGAVSDAYAEAERAVARAWATAKTNTTAPYRYETHRTPGLVQASVKDVEMVKRTGEKRNFFLLNQEAPMVVMPQEAARHTKPGWTVTPEGHWQHESNQVRIRLDIKHNWPHFEVEEKTDEVFVSVRSAQTLNEALLVAELTQRFSSEGAVKSWDTTMPEVVKHQSVSWPTLVEVRGTAFVTEEDHTLSIPRGSVVMYQLRRELDNPVSKYAGKQTPWKWEVKVGSEHGSAMPHSLAPGPEDQALAELNGLKDQAQALQQESLTSNALVDALKPSSQEWLERLYEANLNGEWEDPTPEAIRARWAQQEAAWTATAEKEPALQAFRAASKAMAENAEALVHPPAPRSRGPRPGR